MRVLWLTPGFPSNEQDENCLPTLQLLAREIHSQGVDLQVISLDYPFSSKPFHWHGIPIQSSYGPRQKWFRWYNWARMARHAKALHQSQKFDLIHSFWLGPAWLIGNHLQQQWNLPHWTTLMGQDVLPKNKYSHFLKARQVKSLIAVSSFQKDIFRKTTGLEAGHTIPWGIRQAEIPANFPEHRPLDILGCGSLVSVKDWALWIQVVAEIANKRPKIRAELIGDGPEKSALEKQIQQSRLSQNIRLRGPLSRNEVLTRMLESRVFLHTARFESFGFVLAEAAMNGCRVVSTPVGIAPQLCPIGQTVGDLSAQSIAALDQTLLKNPNTPFSMQEAARSYLLLYQSC